MKAFNNCLRGQPGGAVFSFWAGAFLQAGKALLVFSLFFVLVSCGGEQRSVLTIATAANMQYAMQALTERFEALEGIPCRSIVSSSGKLTAQITEGAPFDVFVSADMKYPRLLCEQGLCVDSPQIYAYGGLVLWTAQDDLEPSLEALFSPRVRQIALPNPRTAPYGRAAMEVLRNMGAEPALQEKLVYGESISQTNPFILSGNAELGFTARSVVLSPAVRDLGKWAEVPDTLYTPIAQGVVVLKGRPGQLEAARAFRAFLFSAEAREILRNFGYQTE